MGCGGADWARARDPVMVSGILEGYEDDTTECTPPTDFLVCGAFDDYYWQPGWLVRGPGWAMDFYYPAGVGAHL